MKQIWIEYRDIIFPIVFFSFGILWLSLNLYIWECYVLTKYKKQIEEEGKIINPKIGYPFLNLFMIFYIFTSIPSIDKYPHYYKYKLFDNQIKTLKSFRRFYRIAFPIYIFGLIPLTLFLEELYH